ncbi:DegT/DnrJ/EryC1/StrS family aminotransferase [Acetobacter oeni]|uniref:Aminotransferase DegT n=1 Tax=Acetobacter oeni TaxID=304077 RepID=A0A511XH98_9PROT|nr:DegT/DnrJ/EryC1/StrS family aminotransferase [Acetobacter oeni]MBB3882466.1 dTDP-4-amino-4,6-dideoxygalactose transaminase [Acetobacter oeni]NHO18441.1 transcriptional regulator [Acetobacter oeni]GBR03269.1 pleiotropic regulatory protein DnrJ/EryC1/StrS [Acetobacter oeni LMG 21952]GEN62320.1 aminotransferase DegT [Acetobacter oeni]
MPDVEISFLETNIPKLSRLSAELEQIEDSGIYSNYGPVNSKFENSLRTHIFGGNGHCLTVCNATIGLILALKYVTRHTNPADKPYIIMPSFTFAAAGHAVLWAGFTPLFVDVAPDSWSSSHEAEKELLRTYSSKTAAIFPYATFGNSIDLEHYSSLSDQYGIPVVVDAASSLGSLNFAGKAFGSGFPFPVVFSLHATKTMGVGEGGFIYSSDATTITQMRAMGNFGFEKPRHATIHGLNSKLPEVSALLGLEGLKTLNKIAIKKENIAANYQKLLPELQFQKPGGRRAAYQFMPARIPNADKTRRARLLDLMKESRIGTASYFSPHLAEQEYFSSFGSASHLPVTEALSSSIISLPVKHTMTTDDVAYVASELKRNMQRAFN